MARLASYVGSLSRFRPHFPHFSRGTLHRAGAVVLIALLTLSTCFVIARALARPANVTPQPPQQVVVFLGGLNTSLDNNCNQPTFLDPTQNQLIRDLLSSAAHVADPYTNGCNSTHRDFHDALSSMMLFSYKGGTTDSATSTWLPAPYGVCDVNNSSIHHDAVTLSAMLTNYLSVEPNAHFTLVGHSLGGLVALQGAYDFAVSKHNPKFVQALDKIITIDSPLNGALPNSPLVDLILKTSCNNSSKLTSGKVVQDLQLLTNASTSPDCSIGNQLVQSQCATDALVSKGIGVDTIGNSDDLLYCNAIVGPCDTQILDFPAFHTFDPVLPTQYDAFGHGAILQTLGTEQAIVRYILAPVVHVISPPPDFGVSRYATGTPLAYNATVRCTWGAASNESSAIAQVQPSTADYSIFAGTGVATNRADTVELQGVVQLPPITDATGAFQISAGGDACQYPTLTDTTFLPQDSDYAGGVGSETPIPLRFLPVQPGPDEPSPSQPPNPVDNALPLTAGSLRSPVIVRPSQQFDAYFDYLNSGTTIWSDTGGYALICDQINAPQSVCLNGTPKPFNGSLVGPQAQATFHLTLTAPDAVGTYVTSWSLAKNGQIFGQTHLSLTITVAAPHMQITPTVVNLTIASGANPSPQLLTLTNSGTSLLQWSAGPLPSWVSVAPTSGSLAVGDSQSLTISFSLGTASPGTYTSSLSISDPNADNSPVSVPITVVVNAPISGVQVVPQPHAGTVSNILKGVAGVSVTNFWAVGYYDNSTDFSLSQTLIEQWDGARWTVVPSPNVGTKYNLLNGVAALSASDIWAVGAYFNATTNQEQTLILRWDGASWTVVPSPNVVAGTSDSNALTGVTAIAANDIWAVGSHFDSTIQRLETLTLHWDGVSWSVISSPDVGTANNELTGVSATSSGDVWAVGDSAGSTQTLIEHWNGTSWSVVPSANPVTGSNYFTGVTAISATDAWAVGVYSVNPSFSQTLFEHWDGTSWSVVSGPSLGTSTILNGVAAVSPSDVWAVGGSFNATSSHFQPYVAHWDGTQWSTSPSPSGTGDTFLNGVAGIPAGVVWVVGS